MIVALIGGLTVFNILPGVVAGFGEEFGHRGFMFPQLYAIKPWIGLIIGGLIWYLATDVRRHRDVIRCLLWLTLAFGAGVFVLDGAVGLPLVWILAEGPCIVASSCLLLWVTRRIGKPGPASGTE